MNKFLEQFARPWMMCMDFVKEFHTAGRFDGLRLATRFVSYPYAYCPTRNLSGTVQRYK